MIFKITYGGKGYKTNKGKKELVELNPAFVLRNNGPFLEVVIGPPKAIREIYNNENKKFPVAKVMALIDTGASISVIKPEIINNTNLIHTGYQKIASVQDEQHQPVYSGSILFPWGSLKDAPLVACPLKNVDCLIGRDVLQHWYMTYDGVGGSLTICD